MGAVESLPASRTGGLGDVLHECAPPLPRNRRYIFGSRRQDRQAATNSPNSSGSSLLLGGGGQKEALKSATVCYLSSTGHGGIVLGGRDGGAIGVSVSQSSSTGLSSLPLQPRSSRTRGRLRDSLKRRSLWQLSSTWTPLQSREQDKQGQKQENQGDCLLSSDGDAYGLVACGQHQLNVNGDEDTHADRMAAKPPPLQRSLLSASMPDLSIHQLYNQECEVSSGIGAELATYADGSDNFSDEYKDYTIGDVNEIEAAQPASVSLTESDIKGEEREDVPVPRPKSRRKLGPWAIGKYLSNRLSAYGHSTSTPSCDPQSKRNTVVEDGGVAKAAAETNTNIDQIESSLLATQSGDDLVQLNTDFSHMEMRHSGCAEEDGARSSLEALVSPSTTPWLLLMEEKDEGREPRAVESSGVAAEAMKDINRAGDHTLLADSTSNSTHPLVLPDDVALLSSSSSSLTLSEIELDGSPHAARPQTRADVGYGGGAGCNDDVLDYDEYIYLSSTCGADKENSRAREGEGGCVESEPDALAAGVALCNNYSPLDYPSREDDDEDDGEETHRWWPRRVLPVRNMQYMPKLNKVFSDCGLQLLGKGDAARDTYTCAHCARGGSANNSNSSSSNGHGTGGAGIPRGHRRHFARDQPLDEAMMLVDDHTSAASAANDAQLQTQTPLPLLASSTEQLYCSDNRCRNYHTRTSLVMRWLATGYPAKPAYRKESGCIIQQNHNSPCKSDYWDLLSRFPIRPTSSLALSSLREMAMSCSDDNSNSDSDSGSQSRMQTRRLGRSCVGLPGNCAGSYTGAAGDSDTDESTSDTDETYSSCKMRVAGSLSLNSTNQQQQQRSKQKQKRVLSEPMQYILYNSYLRYYGKPNEQPLS
ncbi:hypothetical protein IWW48_005584 [Coemansia sp. RSA 1200]|nr:hypothetical protein IWW48_005584 [Coemansia sp. RSA 1200]